MAERHDTGWQQGFILNGGSAAKLGILNPEAANDQMVVLISHDCDLLEPAEIEPDCEIIIGRRIDALDGLYTNAKSPRRLHLSFSGGSEKILLEFIAVSKSQIKKADLLSEAFVHDIRLNQDEHFVLQSWLAARYYRPIFPDEFDRRLKAKPAETHKKIANAIKITGKDIVAVLFDIDAGKDEVHDGPDDPYSLEILLIYSVSEDPGRAQAAAAKAASTIKSLFRQYYFSGGKWVNIELRRCLAVSEDAITLSQVKITRPWHFDYLDVLVGG